jgi:hypothetical protein
MRKSKEIEISSVLAFSAAYVLLPVNSNKTLLELSIALLKNTRQIVFEGCFESSNTTVALESRFNLLSKTF